MKKMLLSISASLLFVLTCANFVSAQSVAGDWEVTVVSPNGPADLKSHVHARWRKPESDDGTASPYRYDQGFRSGAEVYR